MATVTFDKATRHYPGGERPAVDALDLEVPNAVVDEGFTAEYSAPSAGPPPWYLYRVEPEVAFGVATAEPHGATRWRF